MDKTEGIRRVMVSAINSVAGERELLEKKYGQVWDTQEVQKDFEVIGFLAPFIGVKERATGKEGTMLFQHSPRYYFQFKVKGEQVWIKQ